MDPIYQDCCAHTRGLIAAMDSGNLGAVEAKLKALKRVLAAHELHGLPAADADLEPQIEALRGVVAGVDDAVRLMRIFTQRQFWLIMQARPALERLVSKPESAQMPVC